MRLETQINSIYGGQERTLEKEEKMNTVMNENRQLTKQLEELQKETADIEKFERKINKTAGKLLDEINETKQMLQQVKDDFRDLTNH